MTSVQGEGQGAVRGVLDADGRLVEADPRLAALHAGAGGRAGGMLAVPQVAALARLARRLGITISRAAIAADEEQDLELWVRAEPRGERTFLTLTGWTPLPSRARAGASDQGRSEDIARAAAEWTWQTDDALRLTDIAGECAAAVARSHADLLGKPLTSLFRFREHEDGSLPILLALAERRRFEGQLAEIRNEGRAQVRLSGVPLLDGAGRFAGFRGSAAPDATAPASSPALREPLDRIIAEAETISAGADGPLSSQYAGYAADIASAGRHLLSLVEDLGGLAGKHQATADAIDLAQLARSAATMLAVRAAERSVRLDAPQADLALPATGDARRVLQILVNLIGNAIRYAPEGGVVEIAGTSAGTMAAIGVTDRGKGIAAADQERVFEKFERVDPAEPDGTGLGLYIARGLARSMGGDIDLVSAPGLGARFTLRLPARAG